MSILDALENPEYIELRNKFDAGLKAIEEKYRYWFEQRQPLFDWDEHDKLGNHTNFLKDNTSVRFWFNNDSELPGNVRAECDGLFNEIFGAQPK